MLEQGIKFLMEIVMLDIIVLEEIQQINQQLNVQLENIDLQGLQCLQNVLLALSKVHQQWEFVIIVLLEVTVY